MDSVFEVYWELMLHANKELALATLRSYVFSAEWPGVYRVGQRRWQLGS